jgi:hypothetical protein
MKVGRSSATIQVAGSRKSSFVSTARVFASRFMRNLRMMG